MARDIEIQAQNEIENAKRLGQDTGAADKRLVAAQAAAEAAQASAKQTAERQAAEEAERKGEAAARRGEATASPEGESKLAAHRGPVGRSSKPVQKG